MLIPTLGCPARCRYCWSSEEGSPVMSIDTVREVVAWLKNFHEDRVTFTFHGGEPLLARCRVLSSSPTAAFGGVTSHES